MTHKSTGQTSTEKFETVKFGGHQAYILSVAKQCKDSGVYTDVVIQCKEGNIKAHRLVLAACSPFLSKMFLSLPDGLPEYHLLIPNISKQIVTTLVDFLYTGKMVVAKSNTWDLQQLVHTLQIDPDNVRIEGDSNDKETEIPSARKRRASQDNSPHNLSSVKEPRGTASASRGRARTRGKLSSLKPDRTQTSMKDYLDTTKGFHDMTNVETWVCTICEQYDPNIPGADKSTTEWIGCDCNRWYHVFCTKLKFTDSNFSCAQLKLKCLQT